MANWNLPAITSGYLDFVTELNEKFIDAATLQVGSPTNLPDYTIRFNRSSNIFEELYQAVWYAKTIGIAGGGTGSSTAAGARTNLGLGSMATQNSNAVAITGGTITGVAYNANDITSGIVALARGGTGSSLAIQAPGTILMSNGSVVYFDTGINISQLNANALAAGTVPWARLPVDVASTNGNNQWNGYNNFLGGANFTPSITITAANSAAVLFHNTTGPVDKKNWHIYPDGGGNFTFLAANDAVTGGVVAALISSSGLVVGASGQNPIYADGSPLTNLNAGALTSGIVPIGRLGTNAPTGGYFLGSDNTWQPVTTASVDPVPSGLIGMFMAACPAGWTRVSGLDNRFPLGSPSPGLTGGNITHLHRVDGSTAAGGTHRHHASLSGSASGTVSGRTADETNQAPIDVNRSGPTAMLFLPHSHAVSIGVTLPASVSGDTDDNGNHAHTFSVDTAQGGDYPPYMSVVFCQKN